MHTMSVSDASQPTSRALNELLKEQVYAFVRRVPAGHVVSYREVAQACPPLTARQVGRLIAFAPEDVPWWRVVGADGTLRIHKRDPMLAQLQRAYLEAEGVAFDESGRVASLASQAGERRLPSNQKGR